MRNTRIAGCVVGPVAAALLMAVAASAQVNTSQKVGVIDMQAALTTTKEGQKAAADLRAKYSPKQQDFQQRQNEIQQKQEQYKRAENTMSEEAKDKLAHDIDALQKNLERDTQDAEQDMNQDQQRIVQDLSGKMMKIVSKYAEEHKFQLVFDVAGQPNNIFFASNTVDITRDIIALYDQEHSAASSTSNATSSPTSSFSGPSKPAGAAGGASTPGAAAATANARPK